MYVNQRMHLSCLFHLIYTRVTRVMTCNTDGAGTSCPTGAPEFTTCFKCCSIFSFLCSDLQVLVCPFVLFLLAILLSVLLRFMDYDYHFGILKLFFIHRTQNQCLCIEPYLTSMEKKRLYIRNYLKLYMDLLNSCTCSQEEITAQYLLGQDPVLHDA